MRITVTAIVLLTLTMAASAAPAAPVPFSTVAIGSTSAIEIPEQTAIRTSAAWLDLWHRHAGRAKVPPRIEFSRHMIVAVFGGRTAKGTRVRIARIERQAGQLLVTFEGMPGPTAAAGTDTPFHIARCPQSSLPVAFAVRAQESEPLPPPTLPHTP